MAINHGAFCCVALLLCGGLQAKGTPPDPDESGHALPVDDLRDLLLASMQNTISLTELATQQATKVSAITTSLIEARNEIDQLKSKIDKLEEGQTEQNKNLSGNNAEIEGLKSDLSAKIEDLEEGQSELTAQMGDVSWPEGKYCILASGACPAGFTRYSGHIKAFDTASHSPNHIKPAVFGDSYMGCHGYCGQHTSWDAEFGITSCCK